MCRRKSTSAATKALLHFCCSALVKYPCRCCYCFFLLICFHLLLWPTKTRHNNTQTHKMKQVAVLQINKKKIPRSMLSLSLKNIVFSPQYDSLHPAQDLFYGGISFRGMAQLFLVNFNYILFFIYSHLSSSDYTPQLLYNIIKYNKYTSIE